jgi:hypothetical protein
MDTTVITLRILNSRSRMSRVKFCTTMLRQTRVDLADDVRRGFEVALEKAMAEEASKFQAGEEDGEAGEEDVEEEEDDDDDDNVIEV